MNDLQNVRESHPDLRAVHFTILFIKKSLLHTTKYVWTVTLLHHNNLQLEHKSVSDTETNISNFGSNKACKVNKSEQQHNYPMT
jgi:hypothetical protein